jgi:hypothetical protein
MPTPCFRSVFRSFYQQSGGLGNKNPPGPSRRAKNPGGRDRPNRNNNGPLRHPSRPAPPRKLLQKKIDKSWLHHYYPKITSSFTLEFQISIAVFGSMAPPFDGTYQMRGVFFSVTGRRDFNTRKET